MEEQTKSSVLTREMMLLSRGVRTKHILQLLRLKMDAAHGEVRNPGLHELLNCWMEAGMKREEGYFSISSLSGSEVHVSPKPPQSHRCVACNRCKAKNLKKSHKKSTEVLIWRRRQNCQKTAEMSLFYRASLTHRGHGGVRFLGGCLWFVPRLSDRTQYALTSSGPKADAS